MLGEKNKNDEFVKLEVVLRGNHLVKKNWNKNWIKKSNLKT